MHLLLTDRLTCPRCGPAFGLILLADELVDRKVHEGTLGCPNCRDRFPVRGGFADLRAPPRGHLPAGRAGGRPASPGSAGGAEPGADEGDALSSAPGEHPEAHRLVALVGIHRGPGTVAMIGRPARHAGHMARSVEEIQVVAIDPDTSGWPDQESVSRMVAAPGLPFFSRALRGVVVDGVLGRALLFEAGRVTAPMSRVVVTDAPDDAGEVLEEAGLSVLAAESGTVVAARG